MKNNSSVALHDMAFNLAKILQSKREFRQRLAARPIEEKLAMLDALRERALAIRPVQPRPEASVLREEPARYRTLSRENEGWKGKRPEQSRGVGTEQSEGSETKETEKGGNA